MNNIYVEILENNYADLLERAIIQGYIVCIPLNVEASEITSRFIMDHLIMASPYAENTFQTMTGKTLTIVDSEIKSYTGYMNEFTLQKLNELNAHDSKGRVYKQVFISGSLEDCEEKNCALPIEPIYQFFSAKEYIGYLEVVVENNEAALMYANAFSSHFNNNYIIFKKLSKDCFNKIKTALNDLKAIILKTPDLASCELSAKHMQYVCEMTESNIIVPIYNKLFTHVREFVREEDEEFARASQKLLEVEQWSFLPEFLYLEFAESLAALSSIHEKKTPWEKQEVILGFVNMFEKECKNHLVRNNSPKAESWELSADEFIPLLMYFLCKHRPKDLNAGLTFIRELSVTRDSSGGRTYQFTNLYAAFHGIKQLADEHKEPQLDENENENENEEEETVDLSPKINLPTHLDINTYGAFGPPSRRL